MKISNWTRCVRQALVAVGLCLPMAASAAELSTNLVVNGGFESVNAIDGPFTAVGIEGGWSEAGVDTTPDLFAYPYSSLYAGVIDPPGAGAYHYSGGFGTSVNEVQIFQSIDLSTGAVAAAIAGGSAAYDLSAYFSTYAEQIDASELRVRFLDSASAGLGSATIGGAAFIAGLPSTERSATFGPQKDWGFASTQGVIPVGATSAVVEILSAVNTSNHDGYVDLVSFTVVPEPTAAALAGAALAAAGSLALGRPRR